MNIPTGHVDIIFIAGFPRSGTTWFANIVNSDPDTLYRHELLGRKFDTLPDNLFKALKYNNGLNKSEHQQLMPYLLKAEPDTDKPPFFYKNYLAVKSKRIHHYCWLIAKMVPLLQPLYRRLYTPNQTKKIKLFIKETRSTVNMDSILTGLDPTHSIFLYRHPYGVISSNIAGRKSGLMEKISEQIRSDWYSANANTDGTIEFNPQLNLNSVLNISDVEFLALQWAKHNVDFIELAKQRENCHFISYEELLNNSEEVIRSLFQLIQLDYDKQTQQFIDETSTSDTAPRSILNKDASNDFYSVYRGNDFDPNKWSKTLTPEDCKKIDAICNPILEQLEHCRLSSSHAKNTSG